MKENVPAFIKANVALLALKDLSTRLGVEVSCALTLTGSGFKVVGNVQLGTKDNVFMPQNEHAWLFHTHLGSNIPPSKNDLSVALTYGYNKFREAVHIIYDDYYIWWLCVKEYIDKIQNYDSAVAREAIVATLATYEKLLKKYITTNKFRQLKKDLLSHGISVNRISINELNPQ
jgi:hypothetical protein